MVTVFLKVFLIGHIILFIKFAHTYFSIQLLKRTEAVEKEKNDAVCRYAAREALLMRLQTQIEGLEVQVHFN